MEIRQPVALVHANGTVATVLAVNVSRGGLQVTCDRYTLDALLPSGAFGRPAIGTPVDAHFKLPLRDGLVKLDINCRVAYVTRLEPAAFLIGLEFSSVDPAANGAVDAFLEEARSFDLA